MTLLSDIFLIVLMLLLGALFVVSGGWLILYLTEQWVKHEEDKKKRG